MFSLVERSPANNTRHRSQLREIEVGMKTTTRMEGNLRACESVRLIRLNSIPA